MLILKRQTPKEVKIEIKNKTPLIKLDPTKVTGKFDTFFKEHFD